MILAMIRENWELERERKTDRGGVWKTGDGGINTFMPGKLNLI